MIPVSAFLVALTKSTIYIILLKDQADRTRFANKRTVAQKLNSNPPPFLKFCNTSYKLRS